jgi:hypothetical protein
MTEVREVRMREGTMDAGWGRLDRGWGGDRSRCEVLS